MIKLSDRVTPKWRHRLFVAYLVGMLLAFLIPTPETGIEWRYVDKAVHFLLFLGFVLVFYVDRHTHPGRMFVTAVMFAAGIELIQWVLPYRDVELADFIAGAAGAAVASLALRLWRRQET